MVKKDSHWWKWRYDISPEHYRIFSLTSDDKSHKAYLVAKFSRKFLFFLQIDICDVVGVSEKLEVNILKNFIQRFSSPFSKIRIWSKGSSKAEALLKSFSFSLDKKINFVLFKNFGYKFITEHNINFTLDLGDTDNT